jgi:hypothetical protein
MLNNRSVFVVLGLLAIAVFSLAGLPLSQFSPAAVQAQYTDPVDPNNPDVIVTGKVNVITPVGPRQADAFGRILNSRNLGNGEVINFPYIRAVDVFVFYLGQTFKGDFAEGLSVCLRGSGRLLFAPVKGAPRVFSGLQSVDLRPGFVCGFIGQPGTVVLVPIK